jgi:hypothetical protein
VSEFADEDATRGNGGQRIAEMDGKSAGESHFAEINCSWRGGEGRVRWRLDLVGSSSEKQTRADASTRRRNEVSVDPG